MLLSPSCALLLSRSWRKQVLGLAAGSFPLLRLHLASPARHIVYYVCVGYLSQVPPTASLPWKQETRSRQKDPPNPTSQSPRSSPPGQDPGPGPGPSIALTCPRPLQSAEPHDNNILNRAKNPSHIISPPEHSRLTLHYLLAIKYHHIPVLTRSLPLIRRHTAVIQSFLSCTSPRLLVRICTSDVLCTTRSLRHITYYSAALPTLPRRRPGGPHALSLARPHLSSAPTAARLNPPTP